MMDLKTVFSAVGEKFSSTKTKQEYFLAVKISSKTIVATAWTIISGKVEIGEIAESQISNQDFDSLLHSADEAISKVSQKVTPEVNKVIFATPFSWTDEGKLHPEKLADLRRLCKELDLVPLGYVLVSEALENFFKEVEGAPLTAILANIDNEQSVLTLYRAGKDLGTVPLGLTDSFEDDIVDKIEKALKRFSQLDALPARIILYNGGDDLEKIAQKITAYPWTGRLPFLHFPKVEQIPSDFVVKAVAAASGSQMGAKLDLDEIGPVARPSIQEPTETQPIYRANEPPTQMQTPELEEVEAKDAGFVEGPDWGGVEVKMPPPQPPSPPPEQESFTTLPQTTPLPSKNFPSQQSGAAASAPKLDLGKSLTSLGRFAQSLINSLKGTLPKSSPASPSASTGGKLPGKSVLLVIFLLLITAVILFCVAIYFLPKADILLTVSAKPFEHELAVGVNTDTSTSTSAQSITGQYIDAQEISSKKGVTTGKKLVGDKAKGSVSIYSVSDGKSFPAETIIVSPDGLKFTLSRDVSVASGDAISPATVTTDVQAADIGDSYNLPSGTKFTIGNVSSSQYLAKNDTAFSGGNSHQATVVTKADQDRLMATLSAQLTSQAQSDLQSKVGPTQTLLPTAVTSQISKKRFSKNVDDEADTLSLDLTMDFRGVVFNKDEAVSLFGSQYSSDIPSGYTLSIPDVQINVKDAKVDKKGNITLTMDISGSLKPQIDKSSIVKNVSGKNLKSATTYLSALPGVSAVEVAAQPKIFQGIFSLALPWKKDSIKVDIITQ